MAAARVDTSRNTRVYTLRGEAGLHSTPTRTTRRTPQDQVYQSESRPSQNHWRQNQAFLKGVDQDNQKSMGATDSDGIQNRVCTSPKLARIFSRPYRPSPFPRGNRYGAVRGSQPLSKRGQRGGSRVGHPRFLQPNLSGSKKRQWVVSCNKSQAFKQFPQDRAFQKGGTVRPPRHSPEGRHVGN